MVTNDSNIAEPTSRRWIAAFLLFLVLASGGVWAFAEIADWALGGDSHAFDRSVILSMRDSDNPDNPIGPEWLEELGRDFTALGGTGVLTALTLVGVGYLLLLKKWKAALFLAGAILLGLVISSLLKEVFDRPRPDLVPHGSHVYTSSFPSGHSMMAAVCYLTLASLLCSIQNSHWIKVYILSVAVVFAILVGVSRVYLGVHWPTDVFAGWLAGAIWAFAAWWIAQRLRLNESPGKKGMESFMERPE